MLTQLDKPAFEILFKKLYAPLCRYCCRFVRNQMLAEEIVMDKFVALWEKRASLQIRTSYDSFMYTAVRNQAIDYLRSRAAKLSMLQEDLTDDLYDDSDPQKTIEYKEFEKDINKAIESLPEKCFIIFSMKRFGEMNNAEIARELRIAEKTVQNQFTRAKKLIQEALLKLRP